MKKLPIMLTVLLTVGVDADVPPRASIDMIVNMAKQSGDFYATAACLNVSKETFLNSYRDTIDDCYENRQVRQAENFMDAFEACIKPRMLQRLGRTQTQADACSSAEDTLIEQTEALENQVEQLRGEYAALSEKNTLSVVEEHRLDTLDQQIARLEEQQYQLEGQLTEMNKDETDREIEAILAAVGDGELSAEQRQKMLELSKAKMQKQGQEVAKTMRMITKASQGTLSEITLPVYKNSKILVHAMDSGMMEQGNQLPAATFVSSDASDKVLAFYKQQLPDFKYKKLSGGEHILMEILPAGFDIVSHTAQYYSTPHVLIRDDNGQPGLTPADTKSFIEIAYRRE